MSQDKAIGGRPLEIGLAKESDQQFLIASQWQLIRWRFTAHKLAMVSLIVLGVFYFAVIFAEFVAPYAPEIFIAQLTLAPPQRIHFVDDEGQFHLRPFVYPQAVSASRTTTLSE